MQEVGIILWNKGMGKGAPFFDFQKTGANLPFTWPLLPHTNICSAPVVALLGEMALLGTAKGEGPSWPSSRKQDPWPLMGGH